MHPVQNLFPDFDRLCSVISESKIQEAVKVLAEVAKPKQIILFGSYARGDATEDSDVDFLVIKDKVDRYRHEISTLQKALLPLDLPNDVMIASARAVNEWGHLTGSGALYWALKEGRVVYERP
jgi:uncharacterized protein